MRPHVIITGCTLECGSFTQHGDLWELGDVYIFNATGEPSYGKVVLTHKTLIINDQNHTTYFERRNVYVVNKEDATLNQAAQDYIRK